MFVPHFFREFPSDLILKATKDVNVDVFIHSGNCCELFTLEGKKSLFFLSPSLDSPQTARASSLLRFLDHTQRHDIPQHSSGQVIDPSQRPLPGNTQNSQQTDIHSPHGDIRTHNPSKRAAADRAAGFSDGPLW